eukprot:CAMPEP_0206020440 /NCGR_PEP_ID=MMETSP1464-20131121/31048_1 /ASSEMBLY_ACC=CAM_ASM_001124 /TAXON_ID=119497 /ORGANISM="Exanthemachrysis gayraliae, Strain RCC1523" /LENGTH=118 /DNA_ID=CAMNT_0053394373 /DNA_START=103 /DNA_END=459 /DNA_ORIENTATION=-
MTAHHRIVNRMGLVDIPKESLHERDNVEAVQSLAGAACLFRRRALHKRRRSVRHHGRGRDREHRLVSQSDDAVPELEHLAHGEVAGKGGDDPRGHKAGHGEAQGALHVPVELRGALAE